jgi:SAM dependent carboxyl methyltransferase
MHMEPMLDTYNDNSALQATCQTVGNPLLADMATAYGDSRSERELKLVRIAEYGCSGGRNSYGPMHTMISTLRNRAATLQAECLLEDLPTNPWHQVMAETTRLVDAFDGKAQVLCSGRSFYDQVCADESIDLAYSYVAAHFLSRSIPLASHVLMHETKRGERQAWDSQAAKDWEGFLLLRARELKRGGKMMISTMSRDASGYSWKEFSHLVWDSMRRAFSRGSLTRRELEELCIPTCLRSEAEIMAPFAAGSPVGSCFRVDSLQFVRTEVEGERALPIGVLAALLRRRVQAVWGGMFLVQLRQLERSEASAREAMSEVWDLFEESMTQDPGRGWLDMRCFYLQVTKN